MEHIRKWCNSAHIDDSDLPSLVPIDSAYAAGGQRKAPRWNPRFRMMMVVAPGGLGDV